MRVVFAGPSLWRVEPAALGAVTLRPPARQGDIVRAVADGAVAVGLVDGLYETLASVWHKDILFALSRGVRVYGAASLGALRAAECGAYGMVGIGAVHAAYEAGRLDDDAAVAQLHAPAELGFQPLTEALVNVEATVAVMEAAGEASHAEADALLAAARRLFFKERTREAVIDAATLPDVGRGPALRQAMDGSWRDVKREDALALLACIRSAQAPGPRPSWPFHATRAWRRAVREAGLGSMIDA